MSESLRVKNATAENKDENVAIKVKNNEGVLPMSRKKGANLAFREMWADAFLRKKAGIEVSENLTVKQKAPSPYMYLRLLIMYVALFTVTLSVFYIFHGFEMYPVILCLIVTLVPVVAIIFFYEMDTSGRLSIYNMLLLFFFSSLAMLTIEFVSARFIYEMGGEAITSYGAMAIGLMESFFIVILCTSFIKRLKIKDMITGVLTGVIIGAGFAVINNLYTCFKGSFVETEYAPMIEVLIYNDALINSLTKVMKPALIQCLLHSVFYVLIGAILGGCFVNAFNKGFKDKVTIYILIVFAFVCWAFATLWVVPFTSILFDYILKAVMTITSIIAVVKTVRTGLRQNTYV